MRRGRTGRRALARAASRIAFTALAIYGEEHPLERTTPEAPELFRLLSQMRDRDVDLVAMDVMEVAPAYDISEITAIAGATLAHDFLCLEAMRRGAAPITPTP